MSNKISLEIQVIDNGRIKIKQFVDEGQKALDNLESSAKNLTRASIDLQAQYSRLMFSIDNKKVFENLSSSIKKAEESVNNLLGATSNLHIQLTMLSPTIRTILTALTTYLGEKALEKIVSYIKSIRQLEDELKALEERLGKLHTAPKVFEFLKEQQRLAEQQA